MQKWEKVQWKWERQGLKEEAERGRRARGQKRGRRYRWKEEAGVEGGRGRKV